MGGLHAGDCGGRGVWKVVARGTVPPGSTRAYVRVLIGFVKGKIGVQTGDMGGAGLGGWIEDGMGRAGEQGESNGGKRLLF